MLAAWRHNRLAPALAGPLLHEAAGWQGSAAAVGAPLWAAVRRLAAWSSRYEGLPPGSALLLDFSQCPRADIEVLVGEHEAIEVEACGEGAHLVAAERRAGDAEAGGDTVAVEGMAEQGRLRITARAPGRFLSIHATTAGGSIRVEAVQEGSLLLRSGGGDVSVPRVKALACDADTGGGSLTGTITGADVQLRSGGGPVELRSLVGSRVQVDTGGGTLRLGAAYADDLRILTGGGQLSVTNIDCKQGRAEVDSGGGRVALGSVDGNLVVVTGGGSLLAQLHEGAAAVSTATSGGDVELFFSPQLAGRVEVQSCTALDVGGTAAITTAAAQPGGPWVLPLPLPAAVGQAPGLQPQPSPSGGRLQRAEQEAGGGEAVIRVDAQGGTVSLSSRDWMEAMRARFASVT